MGCYCYRCGLAERAAAGDKGAAENLALIEAAKAGEPHTCPAHGAHPHGGATCLDCPICRPAPQQAEKGETDRG